MRADGRRARVPVGALLMLDLRGLLRDQILALNLGTSALMVGVVTALGAFRGQSPDWAAWFPPLVLLSILTGPPAWGVLFGLLMVEEQCAGVNAAVAVSPVPAGALVALRSGLAYGLQLLWGLASVLLMTASWQSLGFGLGSWLAVLGGLALGAPATALLLAGRARDQVQALALFKGINFVALAPLLVLLLPEESPWRWVALVSPPGWGLVSVEALAAGHVAWPWLVGLWGVHLAVLAVASRSYSSTRSEWRR